MTHDPISDFFARIKNAYMAGKNETDVPYSKMKLALAEILKNQGYLGKVEIKGSTHKDLIMSLLYQNKEPKITDIIMVSKPGKRVYVKRDGPKGDLQIDIPAKIDAQLEPTKVKLTVADEKDNPLLGLYNSLIRNAISGVS